MMACVATSTPSPLTTPRPLQLQADDHNQLRKGPYTITKELGSGLHGRVLLAYDDRLQKDVAVKLPAALTVDALTTDRVHADELERQVTSIVHECNAMRRVQHPNVLQIDRLVSGVKLNCDYVALVTEFAPNGDMFDLLEAAGTLPEPLVKVYACQLLRALLARAACLRANLLQAARLQNTSLARDHTLLSPSTRAVPMLTLVESKSLTMIRR